MNIYTKKNNSFQTSWCIIYAKPIFDFDLKSDIDVTALHLAEHCAFNDEWMAENQRCKITYGYGRGTVEGKITKQWIGFILSFYPSFYKDAILWFTRFIDRIKIKSGVKEINYHKKELSKELHETVSSYLKYSLIRKKLFLNKPFSLSSGGKAKFIDRLTSIKINQYKKELLNDGQYFINITDQKLSNFKDIKFVNFLQAPKANTPAAIIKNFYYLDTDSLALVLPPMLTLEKSYLAGLFDYYKNEFNDFGLEYVLSLFKNHSVIFLTKKNIKKELKFFINFLKIKKL